MSYLDDLRREGYLVAEHAGAPLFTAEDDGSLVMEWQTPMLAVRLTAENADRLAAGVEDARHREAEATVDDSTLWPPHG